MFYHDDEKGHLIIGEAAVSLASAGQDSTVGSLRKGARVMAES